MTGGYAKGVQFLYGGKQSGTILIWGYATTKRLRTPALDYGSSPHLRKLDMFSALNVHTTNTSDISKKIVLMIIFDIEKFYIDTKSHAFYINLVQDKIQLHKVIL